MLCFQNLRDYKAPNKRDIRTLSDIYTGAFWENSQQIWASNYFHKTFPSQMFEKVLNALILNSILNLK